jgi:hypothetical protein
MANLIKICIFHRHGVRSLIKITGTHDMLFIFIIIIIINMNVRASLHIFRLISRLLKLTIM